MTLPVSDSRMYHGGFPRRAHCHENSGYENPARTGSAEYELHETGDAERDDFRYTRTKF